MTFTDFPGPGNPKPESPAELVTTENPEKNTTLGLIPEGFHVVFTVMGFDWTKLEHELVPPVRVVVATPPEIADTLEPDVEQSERWTVTVVASVLVPELVRGGEKTTDPVMSLQRTLPVAATGAAGAPPPQPCATPSAQRSPNMSSPGRRSFIRS